jgi:VanZ family protein
MPSRRAIVLWALALAYAAGIFILSSFPVPAPAEAALATLGDKTLHVAEYGGLALLLALAIAAVPSRWRGRAALVAFAVAALYAASDEFHQSFVPGRDADVLDFLADAAGAAVGAGIQFLWARRTSRRAAVSDTSPR